MEATIEGSGFPKIRGLFFDHYFDQVNRKWKLLQGPFTGLAAALQECIL